MWLFVSGGFLSVVAHRALPDSVLVRARNPDHIRAMFPDVEIAYMRTADYPYRVVLNRTMVQEAIVEYLQTMVYGNFKASIEDFEYHDSCIDVWRTMWAYGNRYSDGDV